MATIDIAPIIADLDARRVRWVHLAAEQKRAIMLHYVEQMAAAAGENGKLTQKDYRASTPDWLPTASLSGTCIRLFGCSWTELIARFGVVPSIRHRIAPIDFCECGQVAQHVVAITIGTADGAYVPGQLQLCDGCLAAHQDLESRRHA